jgi:hypothetical protein
VDQTKVRIPKDVLEGLETVWRSGKTNMLDSPRVIELAFEMEFDATAFWVYENPQAYSRGIFQGFEAEEGGDAGCVGRLA